MAGEIITNYDHLDADVGMILDEIRAICRDPRFSRVLGGDDLRIRQWERSIATRQSAPFSLVVIGDFKRGKSTLVNALVGAEVAPMNVLPETMTINKISFAQEPSCTAVLANKKKAALNVGQLSRYDLERTIAELPARIEYIDIRQNSEILRQLSIIDTPGLGDISREFDDQVTEALRDADAVIYVVSAEYPLSATEQNYISAVIAPQRFSRLMLVVNKADIVASPEDWDGVERHVQEKMGEIDPTASVFLVSALDEYCRVCGLTRPASKMEARLAEGFAHLREAIQSDIILQKDIIRSARIVSLVRLMLGDLQGHIDLMAGMMRLKTEEIETLEAQCRDESFTFARQTEKKKDSLSLDIDEMRGEARQWMQAFMERLRSETKEAKASADTEKLQKYYQFYLMENVKEAVSACVGVHQREIFKKLQTLNRSMAVRMPLGEGATGALIADSLADITWTGADTAMFAADQFLAYLQMSTSPLILLGQAVAGFLRQRQISGKKADLLAPVLDHFDEITQSVLKEVHALYEKLKAQSIDALDQLYTRQAEQIQAALDETKAFRANENAGEETALADMMAMRDKVSALMDAIDTYQ